jgi:hypothetical protein
MAEGPDAFLRELVPGNYAGISLLFNPNVSMKTKGGRRVAQHEYLFTRKRTVEDLGGIQEEFEFGVVIQGDIANTYKDKRDALLAKLNFGGPNILIHPTFVIPVTVVHKPPYTLVEDLRNAGSGTITLTFIRAEPVVQPEPGGSKKPLLDAKRPPVVGAAAGTFNQAVTFVNPSALGTITGAILAVASMINGVAQKINEITDKVNRFRNAVNALVESKNNVSASILGLHNIVAVSSIDIRQKMEIFDRIIFDDELLIFQDPVTMLTAGVDPSEHRETALTISDYFDVLGLPEFEENANNNAHVATLNNVSAFMNNISNFVNLDFFNDVELEERYNKLLRQYYLIVKSFTIDINKLSPSEKVVYYNSKVSDDLKYELDLVIRLLGDYIAEELSLDVPNVTTVNQKDPIPLIKAVYQYTGDPSLYKTIKGLNPWIKDFGKVSGKLKIITPAQR